MEEGSDTPQTGWRGEMVEKSVCDRVCVSVRICGVDQEWVMEAEGNAGFKCSSWARLPTIEAPTFHCTPVVFRLLSHYVSYFLLQFKRKTPYSWMNRVFLFYRCFWLLCLSTCNKAQTLMIFASSIIFIWMLLHLHKYSCLVITHSWHEMSSSNVAASLEGTDINYSCAKG